MKLINHQLTGVRCCVSPNQDDRPPGPEGEISLVVIHCISLPEHHFGTPWVEALFCNELDCDVHPAFGDLEGLRVSAHLFIRRDGRIIQFVPFSKRAWHAGESSFEGRMRCNDFSIGIELEGSDTTAFSEAQYAALSEAGRLLCGAYGLDASRFVGHCDIAPGRKRDPGSGFDWQRLREGLAGPEFLP